MSLQHVELTTLANTSSVAHHRSTNTFICHYCM